MTSPPIKWWGGQTYMAKHHHALAAPYKKSPARPDGWFNRVIPYAGGLGEFWAWEHDNVSEICNDLDERLMDFYRVLQGPEDFDRFQKLAAVAPFSEALWCEALEYWQKRERTPCVDRAQAAYYLFILIRQSRAGGQKDFAPLTRSRLRRGMQEQASAWLSAIDGLPEAHKRLQRVTLTRRPALELMKQQDGPGSLLFLDPPFLGETRASPNIYVHEMTERDHKEMLSFLVGASSWVMLCGYHSDLYTKALVGWDVHEHDRPNNTAGGKSKRRMTAVIWTNFSLKDKQCATQASLS